MPTAAPDLLSARSITELAELGPVEVVAAVHAQNRAATVAGLLDVLDGALAERFAGRRALVLAADTGSQDGTADILRAWCAADRKGPARLAVEPAPPAQPGRAVRALLAAAEQLDARAIAVLDADLAGARPDWISALLEPLFADQADFVSPSYSRAPAEGTLTTNLLAPLTRALYGKRVQQITGGCAALAAGVVAHCLEGGVGGDAAHAHGVEIAVVTAALASGARVAEAHLGRRLADPGVPALDLATTLVRTVGPVFELMERYHDAWEQVAGSADVPCAGAAPAILPGAADPSVERMVEAFDLGMKDLLPVWEQIMPESTLARLYPLTLLEPDVFEFRPAVWARVVMDFAVAHHERRLPRDHLLRSLTPLYLGRVAAFLREARRASANGTAGLLDQIGRAFEAEKEDLAARWR